MTTTSLQPPVCSPMTCWGLLLLPPFPMGGASPSVPPFNLVCCMYGFAVIVESSRYMSPYPQSTPRGATSRCGGRLTADDTNGATISYSMIPASIAAQDNIYSQSKARPGCEHHHNVQPVRREAEQMFRTKVLYPDCQD